MSGAATALAFAERYDALIAQPWRRELYEGSLFFNTGYWTAATRTQREACENLMGELLRWFPHRAEAILDVACGLGGTTACLRKRYPSARILGVNLSRRQVRICRARVPDCRFAAMDATRLALAVESFDVIVAVEAAFHFDTRPDFLREARRVLKPGGRLILSDILFCDAGVIGEWLVPEENRIEEPGQYARDLATAGFGEIRMVDATRECWSGFCAHLGHWWRERLAAGAADAATCRTFLGLADRLAGSCVRSYLLVTATCGGESRRP